VIPRGRGNRMAVAHFAIATGCPSVWDGRVRGRLPAGEADGIFDIPPRGFHPGPASGRLAFLLGLVALSYTEVLSASLGGKAWQATLGALSRFGVQHSRLRASTGPMGAQAAARQNTSGRA